MIRFKGCTKCGGDLLDGHHCLQCGKEEPSITNHYEPMLAKLCAKPFDSEQYIYEPKLDGIRCIAYVDGSMVTLINRSGNDVTSKFPDIKVRLQKPFTSAVLDGELVCFDEDCRPDFQLMQTRMNRKHHIHAAMEENPAVLVTFDIMERDSESLIKKPLVFRKQALSETVELTQSVRVNVYQVGGGLVLLDRLTQKGWEGVMAKAISGKYHPGARGPEWLKMKARKYADVIVGGVTVGFGKREGSFGALMVGKAAEEGLIYMGEVGTGFSDEDLAFLTEALELIKADDHPFTTEPPGIPMVYVEPRLVIKVSYLELTSSGIMRHASYEGVVDANTD